MKKLLLMACAVFMVFCSARAQSGNSNIGTEFWTGWMSHINGATGTTASQMSLYIASDVATTGTISSADGTYTTAFTVVPNKITIFDIPASSYLGVINGLQSKGIHITSKNPIAVYAHIYASSVSGATLLLPVNTLSNDYYSLNYTQLSNATPSYSVFNVIGTEDNTTVQITPTAALIDGTAAKSTITITLNKGQVYQGISNADLTGTKITSVTNGTSGCKKIAVFSGSNKIYIGAPNKTSDNLFQQVYPTSSWGKKYVTVPLKDRNYDIIRIVSSDPTAVITVNGTAIASNKFTNGLYYDFNSQVANYIVSDKPIQVVQYAVTQGNTITGVNSATDVGDPEMIYLNPLEQTIDHVILYSADEFKILKSYINVVLPTAATSSFLLDGVASSTGFITVPNNSAYSYKQLNVTSGATHTLAASQGFNAIAYGFGSAESYGYAAGTNVKNLNEYVQYANPTTNQVVTSGCTNASLTPQVVLPYVTSKITWDLGNGTSPVVQNNPNYKSTFVKNGVTLYLYDYGSTVTYTPGSYAVKITVFNPVVTLCGSDEEVNLNFTVADPPTAKFTSRDTICVTDTLGFKDLSSGNGSSIQSWHWDFGNGDTSIVQNPVYKYLTPGNYTIALTVTIPTGCQSIYTKKVHIRAATVAAFTNSTPDCETLAITLTDQSIAGEGKITQWVWNYGDGTPAETRTNNTPFTHTYATAGNYTITLQVLNDKACFSTTLSKVLAVHPHPIVAFSLPDVCLANAAAQFTDQSTISDNTSAQFKYLWDFGDVNSTVTNANTSALKSPTHQFTKAGTYHVSLTVISKDTCTITLAKDFLVSGQANFTAPLSTCPADTVLFTDKTDGATKAASAWHWDFGDGDTSAVQSPKHAFKNPGDYSVVLTVKGHNGCSVTSFSQNMHINKKPSPAFTNSAPACETVSITFTDTTLPNEGTIATWIWDFGDGTPVSNLQNPVHVFKPFATYNVKLTVTTSLGCTSAIIQPVTVNPQPVASFVLPDVCVSDGKAYFNARPDANGVTYNWDFGDNVAANITASNPNTATGINVSHHYQTAGFYNARLTVITANGCTADTVKQFRVNGSSPKADFEVMNAGALCSSNEVFFTNKASIPGFGDEISSVDMYYDFVGSPTVKVHYDRPSSGQLLRHLYPLNNLASQQYTVHMVAYSGQTCFDMKDVMITVLPVPLTTFKALPDVCEDASSFDLIPYTTASGPAGVAKFYLDGSTVQLSGNKFNPGTAGIGTHKVTFIYTPSSSSCADTLYQNITVAPVPTANAGVDQEVIAGESVTLHGIAPTGGNYKIRWTPSATLSDSTILDPIATPKTDTRYKLTVTLTTGSISCPVSDSVDVKLLHVPVIPNTFTPNNDGFNDTWEIKYLDRYPNCTVRVYNRSGDLVYSDSGYKVPWDGTYKGNALPVGTYFYIVDPGHKLDLLSGSVNLIR